MPPLTALAIVYTVHTLVLALLAYSVTMAAYRHSGWPICAPEACRLTGRCKWRVFKWPVAGRWLLSQLLIGMALLFADLTWAIWNLVEVGREPQGGLPWRSVLIRALPIPIEIWTWWRQFTRGLVNDPPRPPRRS